jgi:hypothetical protein
MAKERNSSFELLRILCMLGILYMHLLGVIGADMSTGTRGLRIISDSMFNAGVSCFMLISGYFGIRKDIKKLVRLDLMAICYSLAGLVIKYACGETFGIKEILGSVFPVISGKYWFLSCYVFIAVLAPFIENALQALGREQHKKLIGVLVLLFYLIPTVLYFQLLQDNGKGIVNLLAVYIIGRYMGMYQSRTRKPNRSLGLYYLADLLIVIGLNAGTSLLTGTTSTLWSRDCSILILLAAVILFRLFEGIHVQSTWINSVAKRVLAVYVLSPFIQTVIGQVVDISSLDGRWFLGLLVLGLAILIFAVCAVVDVVRELLLGKAEDRIAEAVSRQLCRIEDSLWSRT